MVRYKMVGRDINSNPTQFRTWIVPDTPDFTGQFYTGLKSGQNALVDIYAAAILDDTVIADFDLPVPTSWQQVTNVTNYNYPVREVLPAPIEDSQLAILDGYAYMFGGKITNKIYRADLNNPDVWVDTGATLPSNLYAASLAIVDGYIILIGGNNGNESDVGKGALDTLYYAPISNPLNWTNYGSVLPRKLQYSNLGVYNGQMYLFGGKEINDASNVIFTASASNPFVWTDTLARLPVGVYNSCFGQVNGNWMIFGGLLFPDTLSNLIWSAGVTNPLAWTVTGALPYPAASGKFVNIGGDGYIFTPVDNPTSTYTSILRANLQVNPNLWLDTLRVVPGTISHSQMAIIYDRIWLFGGSGLSAVFACNQTIKYSFTAPKVYNYGLISRTVLHSVDNINSPYQALSVPWWITDYPFSNRP